MKSKLIFLCIALPIIASGCATSKNVKQINDQQHVIGKALKHNIEQTKALGNAFNVLAKSIAPATANQAQAEENLAPGQLSMAEIMGEQPGPKQGPRPQTGKSRPVDWSNPLGSEGKSLIERVATLENIVHATNPQASNHSFNEYRLGQTDLTEKDLRAIDEAIPYFKEASNIYVIGYADETPPRDPKLTNEIISQQRAEFVANYLREKGIEIPPANVTGTGVTNRYSKKRRVNIICN